MSSILKLTKEISYKAFEGAKFTVSRVTFPFLGAAYLTHYLTGIQWPAQNSFAKTAAYLEENWCQKRHYENIGTCQWDERFTTKGICPYIPRCNQISLPQQAALFAIAAVVSPVIEEWLYRDVVQSRLLKLVPEKVARIFASPQMTKWARIILSSICFSCSHYSNHFLGFSKELFLTQCLYTFFAGIAWGHLKESPLGIWGSIGGHMANNALALSIPNPLFKI